MCKPIPIPVNDIATRTAVRVRFGVTAQPYVIRVRCKTESHRVDDKMSFHVNHGGYSYYMPACHCTAVHHGYRTRRPAHIWVLVESK